MAARLRVWFVDDREENRSGFERRHGSDWDVRTFETPESLLSTLKDGDRPDALLCDIFFYQDEKQREEIEKLVGDQARKLKQDVAAFNPEEAQEGIGLIRDVREYYGSNPPFPIFAYTSKGAYLFADSAYEELAGLDAVWLFKNKYSSQTERRLVLRAISEFQALRGGDDSKAVVVRWAVLSALAGAVLGFLCGLKIKE